MADDDDPQLDAVRVERWRLQILIEAGYPVRMAERLANDSSVDLHQAVYLLEAGCSLRLARKILT